MSQVNGDHRPPYQVFPDLPPEEFETLKQDIAQRGVQVAIELTPEGEILDGHQRVRACQELKIKNYPRRIISGLDEEGKRHHAIKANCLAASVDPPSEEGVDRFRTQAKTKAVQSSAC